MFVQLQHTNIYLFLCIQVCKYTHARTQAQLCLFQSISRLKSWIEYAVWVCFFLLFFWGVCVLFFFLSQYLLGGNVQPLNWLMYILAVWFIIRNSLQRANNIYDPFNLPNHVPSPTIQYVSLPLPSLTPSIFLQKNSFKPPWVPVLTFQLLHGCCSAQSAWRLLSFSSSRRNLGCRLTQKWTFVLFKLNGVKSSHG